MKVQKEKITQTEEISKKLSGFKTELTPNDLIEIEKINEEILTCDQKVKQFLILRYPEKVRPFAFKIEQLFLQRGLLEQKNFKEREALKAKLEGLTGPVISAFKIEFAVEANRIKKLRDYKITNKTYNGKKDGYTYEILSNFSGIDKAMMRLSEGRVKLQGMTFRPLSEIIKLQVESEHNVPDNRLAKERSDFAGQSSSGGYVVLCAALPLNLFRGTSLKPGSMSKHFLIASIKASCSKGSGLTSVP